MSEHKAVKPEKLPLTHGRAGLLVLFGPSTDRMRPTLIRRATRFIQSTDANIPFIQEHPHRPRVMCDQIPGCPVAQSGGHIESANTGAPGACPPPLLYGERCLEKTQPNVLLS